MKKYKINYKYDLMGGSLQSKTRILKKDFLIIIPAGDNSYHHHKNWYKSSIYDLFVIYYGDNSKLEMDMKDKSNFFIKKKGPKWQLVRHVLKTFNWSQYKYIWLPDDDLNIEKDKIEEFFLISQRFKLELSQPSLRPPEVPIQKQIDTIFDWQKMNNNSKDHIGFFKYHSMQQDQSVTQKILDYISFKILLQKYPSNQKMVRYTNFVEIMCPLLINHLVEKTLEWIDHDEVQSGFGIDSLWADYLNNKNIAVIDYISVIHTRPVGVFQKKKTGNFKVLTIDPEQEKNNTFKRANFTDKKSFIKNLREITLNKPKLAFLFLTKGDVRYPKIWETYFKNQTNYNCYIHPKDKTLVKSFLKDHIVSNLVETKWGDSSLINAMNSLLEEAIKNGENQKFIFLSESCLPIKNFDQLYLYLEELNKSVFSLGNGMGEHYQRMKKLYQPYTIGLHKKNFYKSELWSILNRRHVTTILNNKAIFFPVFERVKAPEEHFNVSLILIKHGNNSFVDRRTTFVDWPSEKTPHPTTFGPFLTNDNKKMIKESSKKSFFARKFADNDSNQDNNIEEFILDLISS